MRSGRSLIAVVAAPLCLMVVFVALSVTEARAAWSSTVVVPASSLYSNASGGPAFAAAPDGVIWVAIVGPNLGLLIGRWRPGQGVGDLWRVPGAGNLDGGPVFTISRDGHAILAWETQPPSPYSAPPDRYEAISWTIGGRLPRPVTLSGLEDTEWAPSVAVDDSGRGLVTWFDAGAEAVRSVLLVSDRIAWRWAFAGSQPTVGPAGAGRSGFVLSWLGPPSATGERWATASSQSGATFGRRVWSRLPAIPASASSSTQAASEPGRADVLAWTTPGPGGRSRLWVSSRAGTGAFDAAQSLGALPGGPTDVELAVGPGQVTAIAYAITTPGDTRLLLRTGRAGRPVGPARTVAPNLAGAYGLTVSPDGEPVLDWEARRGRESVVEASSGPSYRRTQLSVFRRGFGDCTVGALTAVAPLGTIASWDCSGVDAEVAQLAELPA